MKVTYAPLVATYAIVGRALFWLLWPLIWLYAPLRVRSRLLVVCGEQVLLVKPHFGSGVWQLPGGGVHKNEPPKAAALRELLEETGVKLSVSPLLELCHDKTFIEVGLRVRYTIFAVTVPEMAEVIPHFREVSAAAWVHPKDVQLANHVRWALQAYAVAPETRKGQ